MMLGPQELERATPGYRRGYNDRAYGRSRVPPEQLGSVWERSDYEQGYAAAENDAKWDEHFMNKARERCEAYLDKHYPLMR